VAVGTIGWRKSWGEWAPKRGQSVAMNLALWRRKYLCGRKTNHQTRQQPWILWAQRETKYQSGKFRVTEQNRSTISWSQKSRESITLGNYFQWVFFNPNSKNMTPCARPRSPCIGASQKKPIYESNIWGPFTIALRQQHTESSSGKDGVQLAVIFLSCCAGARLPGVQE